MDFKGEMMKKYKNAVLDYFRMEWAGPKCPSIMLGFRQEIDEIIKNCRLNGENVPNASKEIEVFLQLVKEEL